METFEMNKNDFCDTETACQILGCSSRSLVRYRSQGKLLENIHYARNPGGRIVMYQYGSDKTLMETKPCEKQILRLLRPKLAMTKKH
jgi:hypothetical protein